MTPEQISNIATTIGVEEETLSSLIRAGEARKYPVGEFLFREATPRLWMGVLLEGEVELRRGAHSKQTHLATLSAVTLLSEGVVLDELPHFASAVALTDVCVWQISVDALESFRESHPEDFYRMVGKIAQRIGERVRMFVERLCEENEETCFGGFRVEHDSLGERELPDHVYYGVQSLRGLENFPLSGIPVGHFSHLVRSLGHVKKAAALANKELGSMAPERADAIVAACDEIIAGGLRKHFVLDMIQGGAGTSTNMNANEVIANRALEILGHRKGEYQYLHPNDDVNRSQSTNDVYPTSIKLAVIFTLRDALSALRELQDALQAKAEEFSDVIKMGRTENQDAVPMTLGQEFSAYAIMVGDGIRNPERSTEEILEINMGGTAVGTGINTHPEYAALCTKNLVESTGLPLRLSSNLVEATQDNGSFAILSGAMRTAAIQLSKICNDLRWLSSGPRCGLNEIHLPPMQPGSSIMPGKVNPVIPEAVNQVCYEIIGNDITISMAAEASELELNMAEPVIAFNLLSSLKLLRNAAIILNSRCVQGIEANRERCRSYVENSIGLVTALVPVIGYENASKIAKTALAEDRSVYELVLEGGLLTQEQLDDMLLPENMTQPRAL